MYLSEYKFKVNIVNNLFVTTDNTPTLILRVSEKSRC